MTELKRRHGRVAPPPLVPRVVFRFEAPPNVPTDMVTRAVRRVHVGRRDDIAVLRLPSCEVVFRVFRHKSRIIVIRRERSTSNSKFRNYETPAVFDLKPNYRSNFRFRTKRTESTIIRTTIRRLRNIRRVSHRPARTKILPNLPPVV